MTLSDQFRASLRADEELLVRVRMAIGARPLSSPGKVEIEYDDARALVRLAEVTVRTKGDPPPIIGARGTLVEAIAGDDRNRLVALIEFDDEDELRRVAAHLAADVIIEPAPPALRAANETEPGEGSPIRNEEDDT